MSQVKSYETIIFTKEENVGAITMNRPEVLNAIDEKMGLELQDALRIAERDEEIRCLVITGAGRAFSAGEDIKAIRANYEKGVQIALGERLRRKYNPIILRLREMEKPIVASVNGVAAGAGAGIAYACDLRIASEKASFIQAFIRVGLAPDSASAFLLARLVGLGKALELSLLGDAIDAREAERIGLVNKVVPHEQLEAATRELASRLAKGPTKAYGLTKRVLNRGLVTDLENALEYEAYIQEVAGRTLDHKEGIKAFFERRQPIFTGR